MFEDKRKHDVAQLLGAEFVSDAESEDDLIDRHTKARLAAFEVEEDQQKQFEEKMRRMEEANREAWVLRHLPLFLWSRTPFGVTKRRRRCPLVRRPIERRSRPCRPSSETTTT